MVVEGVAAEGEEDLVPPAPVGGGRRVEEDGDQGLDVLDTGGLEVKLGVLTLDFDMCQGGVLQRRKGSASYDWWIWRGGCVPWLKILLTEEEGIDQIF